MTQQIKNVQYFPRCDIDTSAIINMADGDIFMFESKTSRGFYVERSGNSYKYYTSLGVFVTVQLDDCGSNTVSIGMNNPGDVECVVTDLDMKGTPPKCLIIAKDETIPLANSDAKSENFNVSMDTDSTIVITCRIAKYDDVRILARDNYVVVDGIMMIIGNRVTQHPRWNEEVVA